MIGSRRDFKNAMVHEGLIRRSDEAFGELTSSGTSGAAWTDILGPEVEFRPSQESRWERNRMQKALHGRLTGQRRYRGILR